MLDFNLIFPVYFVHNGGLPAGYCGLPAEIEINIDLKLAFIYIKYQDDSMLIK